MASIHKPKTSILPVIAGIAGGVVVGFAGLYLYYSDRAIGTRSPKKYGVPVLPGAKALLGNAPQLVEALEYRNDWLLVRN